MKYPKYFIVAGAFIFVLLALSAEAQDEDIDLRSAWWRPSWVRTPSWLSSIRNGILPGRPEVEPAEAEVAPVPSTVTPDRDDRYWWPELPIAG